MATAVQRAFSTVELFEMILLPLSVEGILQAQQVCKWWREVVANSKPLQQELRFEVTSLDSNTTCTLEPQDYSFSTDSDSEDDIERYIIMNPRVTVLRRNALKPSYTKGAQSFKFQNWLHPNATHRDMKISWPGVRRVDVRVEHRAGREVYSEWKCLRASQHHVTIGDLVDALEPMVKKHERSWGEVRLFYVRYRASVKK